jgi:hypothetical protein
MKDKIKNIVKKLNGEKIEDCITILSKVLSEVNSKKEKLKSDLIFKT